MEMFVAIVISLWMPLMLWWLLFPQYFPFFTHKKFGRFSLFGLNLVFYFLAIIIIGLIFPTQEQSASQEVGAADIVGMLAGFATIIWVIVRGIKTGRLAKSKNPTKLLQPSNPKKAVVGRPEDTPKSVKVSQPPKPKEPIPQPPKPALKEDFELGDDNLCQIHYKSSKGEISTRTILIRTLKANKNGDWLVSAVDIEAKRIKSFRIDRIVSLSHNNQAWTEYQDILGIVRTFETLI